MNSLHSTLEGDTGAMNNPYSFDDCGCYFDGAFGDNSDRIIPFAADHGMDVSGLCVDYCECDDFGCLVEIEDYMNDHYPVEGAYWGPYDGDWGLWPIEDD